MTLRQLLQHFENRLFELATTSMMLGEALLIALWPHAIEASAFVQLLKVLSPAWLGFGFLICGSLRLAALIANGWWPFYGPILRAIGAMGGAMIWFQMCIALFQLFPQIGTPSPGIPVYFVLTMFELVSLRRALGMLKHAQVP